MVAAASAKGLAGPAQAIQQRLEAPRRANNLAAGRAVAPPQQCRRHLLCAPAAARRSREEFSRGDDYVAFDDEEEWEQQGSTVQAPGLGPIFSIALRGVNAVSSKITDVALQFAPADASPAVVRVAVNAGLVLVALSFVKSVLSFFLTLGSIILGAYVAVKVFGVDVAGVTGSLGGGDAGRASSGSGGRPRSAAKRKPDPRAPQSEFKGLLGWGRGEDDDGLLDVRFERKGGSGGKGGRRR
ncbi:hypothetical protein ABPG77_006198 [Micractinium sp. CCAP 211/92]